jgi:predicted dehydrogenase
MNVIRAAVVGAGSFGRRHIRVLSQLPGVQLVAIVDQNTELAQSIAAEYNVQAFTDACQLAGRVDAASIVTPTSTHEAIAAQALSSGIDALVEKPIAHSSAAGERLTRLADEHGRILQIGHLERFNPAIAALTQVATLPLFFEIHRLSVFTPRSLDVDVVLDLMIHDLDIVLSLTRQAPSEIRAAGISVLSPKVDIANVRLAFPTGCVANLTASRVSTEKVRKLRLFQPGQYISVDYARQDASIFAVKPHADQPAPDIGFNKLPIEKGEPLHLELADFFEAVRLRRQPRVDGRQATEALRTAESIIAKIKEHGDLVAETVRRQG